MPIWLYPAVVLAGLICGFVNVLAGSGSLVTLPLLIFMGLPANVANGTNRVAILLQNVVGVRGYHQRKALDWARGKWLLLPAALGALVGAQIAVDLSERWMRLTIAVLMVLMFFIILLKPERWIEGSLLPKSAKPGWHEWLIIFGVGIYGGFIQAGVGIFLLAALVLVSGYDLVKANAIKLLIVLGFTPFALLVFIIHDLVHWRIGILLAMGNMVGAWLGARMAVERGAKFVRWILIAVVGLSSLKLFWDVFGLA